MTFNNIHSFVTIFIASNNYSLIIKICCLGNENNMAAVRPRRSCTKWKGDGHYRRILEDENEDSVESSLTVTSDTMENVRGGKTSGS